MLAYGTNAVILGMFVSFSLSVFVIVDYMFECMID